MDPLFSPSFFLVRVTDCLRTISLFFLFLSLALSSFISPHRPQETLRTGPPCRRVYSSSDRALTFFSTFPSIPLLLRVHASLSLVYPLLVLVLSFPTSLESLSSRTHSRVLSRYSLLATNHIFKEVSPDVFANNRLSSVLDTGKVVEELLARLVLSLFNLLIAMN